jgi:hypothetical protein
MEKVRDLQDIYFKGRNSAKYNCHGKTAISELPDITESKPLPQTNGIFEMSQRQRNAVIKIGSSQYCSSGLSTANSYQNSS